MTDVISEFSEVLRVAGFLPGEIIADGVLRRCPTSEKPKRKNGWFALYDGERAFGVYGDWQTGLNEKWTGNGKALDAAEFRKVSAQIERDRKNWKKEEAVRQKDAAKRARSTLDSLPEADESNPYLIRKGVKTCPRLKADGDKLIVPVMVNGKPVSHQTIKPDGSKKFLFGGKVKGGYFPIKGNDTKPLYICEGVATGLSIHEATGATALCAFSKGSLLAVAQMARKEYPKRKIIIAADNDQETEAKTGENPGIKAAHEAAKAINARVVYPEGNGDFNDLHKSKGIEAVRERLLVDPETSQLVPSGMFQDYLEYTGKFSESPPEFHLFTLAYTISCLVGRGRYVQQGEDTIYPNQYMVLIAPSSLYKKSSAGGLSNKWLGRLDHMKGHFLGHIGSPEGLLEGLKENKGTGLLYYSEMGSLLAASNKKWMIDIFDLLNDLYDCPDYCTKRLQSGPKSVSDVYLNMLCATQLDSMSAHVKESTLLSGFLPRFTTVYSENLQPHMVRRPPPDKRLQNKITEQLNSIRQATKVVTEMTLTPYAWTTFEAWAHERHIEALHAPGTIQPMYGRIESHVLKYAIIISVATLPESLEIDEITIEKAIAWGEFILKSYRRLVEEELTFTLDDRRLKKVSNLIKGGSPISYRDVLSGTRYKNRDLGEMLSTLKAMGKIRQVKGPRGGVKFEWVIC